MKILLILNKEKKINKKIISITKKIFGNLTVVYDHENNFFNRKHNFDYTFSFLSKKILKRKFLNNTKFQNINFHPGPPKYPGIGCYNFALYNSEKKYGCTAHLINEKIDNGRIMKVKIFKIKKNNLSSLIKQTYDEMLKLYKVVLNNLSKKKKISSNFKWNKKFYTRKDLEKLALININMKKKDVLNRIKSTFYKKGYGPYIKIYNYIFELKYD